MSRFYLLCLTFLTSSLICFGQLNDLKVKITDNLPKYSDPVLNKKSNIAPKTCGNDTVEYARRKASAFNSISIKKNYSLGQIYGAPQDITVYGFTFYAWAVANPPTTKKVRLICNLYKAGTDSLPSGAPIASDTVAVDSTFGGGLLTKLEKRATFKTPVTVNYTYILTVESDSVNLNAGLVSSSWTASDGEGANLLCGSVSGRWYRGLSLNIAGVNLDADMQLYPHVSYKFGTDFKVADCFDFKDSARFKNSYRSNVSGSVFYSLYTFYNLDRYCHMWNYGEMPWNYYEENGITKYSGKGNFKVRLISYLYQWRGSSACVDTTIKILYFKPSNPVAVSNINICRGNDADIRVASDTGTTIKWYKDPAGAEVFTGELYKLGKIQKNDTFYLKAFNYSCESGFTQLIVTVNDYPKHPAISNDSICLGAKANLEAISSLGKTEWYIDSTVLPFFTGNVYSTGSLTKNETFFVRSNNNGCYSPFFKSVTAFVDASFAPSDPMVSNDTGICLRPAGKAVLKAYSADNDSLRWYNVPSGGSSIARGNSYTFTPVAEGVSTIYVEAQKSICSSSRLPIKITVSDYPSVKQVFDDVKCKGDTAQVGALLTGPGNVKWYLTATGGNSINTGSVIRYFTRKSINLYAEAETNGCANPSRTLVSIKINAYDSITKIDAPLVCGNAKVTLKVTAGTNLVKWYEDAAASKLLASTATYTTPQLLVSTNYYFTVEKNGCKSPVYTVLAEVLPLPVAGYNYTFLKNHKISLVPTATSGVTYKWIMGDGTIYTTRYPLHQYALYGTYNLKLIVTSITSGCTDSSSQDVIYDFSGLKTVNREAISVFPNPTSGNFKLSLPPDAVNGVLSITGNDGRLVYQSVLKGNNEVLIDEKIAKGFYTIKVEWKNKVSFGRLIVN